MSKTDLSKGVLTGSLDVHQSLVTKIKIVVGSFSSRANKKKKTPTEESRKKCLMGQISDFNS